MGVQTEKRTSFGDGGQVQAFRGDGESWVDIVPAGHGSQRDPNTRMRVDQARELAEAVIRMCDWIEGEAS